MKILQLIPSVDLAGGGPIEGVLRQREATLDECSMEIASLDPPDAPFLADHPVTIHALGRGRATRGLLGRYGYSPDYAPWLRENASNYDAIIVNGLWNHSTFAAAQILPTAGTPYFVFPHGMMDPWFRRTYPLKHAAKQAFWLLGTGNMMSCSKAVLFTCEEERVQARGEFFGYHYNESVVGYGTRAAPAFTEAMGLAFRHSVPDLKSPKFILFLGRIHKKKGCDLLIEAFSRISETFPGIDIVLAGPDEFGLSARLKVLASSLGVSGRIHWPGPLYGDAKWGALHGAEAFILPSHQENFGIAVAEALSCGTPVLISDKVNIWREIDESRAGLIEHDTIEGTERMLTRWLTSSDEAKESMGVQAAASFRANFDIAESGPALIRLMKSCL